MLGLKLATDPRWANLAEKDLEEILTDHAYCEQKAALTCISLISFHPQDEILVDSIAPIVTEEWEHFRLVIAEMRKRGLKLGLPRKDQYVLKLQAFQIVGGLSREHRFVERLLTSALIEARSCERFRLLSLHLEDEELKNFYHKFMISEAGHYRLFLDLAYRYAEKDYVDKRWSEYLAFEGEMIQTLELRGDRVH